MTEAPMTNDAPPAATEELIDDLNELIAHYEDRADIDDNELPNFAMRSKWTIEAAVEVIRRQASALAGARTAALEEAAALHDSESMRFAENMEAVDRWNEQCAWYEMRNRRDLHRSCAVRIRALGTPAEKEK